MGKDNYITCDVQAIRCYFPKIQQKRTGKKKAAVACGFF
jgi:hypothetical protein